MSNNNAPIPYRFREAHFRRFEPLIGAAMTASDGVVFNPADLGLTQVRFAQGLRDAMTSLATHKWTSPLLSPSYEQWRHSVKVQERSDGMVAVVPKVSTACSVAPVATTAPVVLHAPKAHEPFPAATLPQIQLLCWLCHNGLVNSEIFLRPSEALEDITPALMKLEALYDVSIDSITDSKGGMLRIL